MLLLQASLQLGLSHRQPARRDHPSLIRFSTALQESQWLNIREWQYAVTYKQYIMAHWKARKLWPSQSDFCSWQAKVSDPLICMETYTLTIFPCFHISSNQGDHHCITPHCMTYMQLTNNLSLSYAKNHVQQVFDEKPINIHGWHNTLQLTKNDQGQLPRIPNSEFSMTVTFMSKNSMRFSNSPLRARQVSGTSFLFEMRMARGCSWALVMASIKFWWSSRIDRGESCLT